MIDSFGRVNGEDQRVRCVREAKSFQLFNGDYPQFDSAAPRIVRTDYWRIGNGMS